MLLVKVYLQYTEKGPWLELNEIWYVNNESEAEDKLAQLIRTKTWIEGWYKLEYYKMYSDKEQYLSYPREG